MDTGLEILQKTRHATEDHFVIPPRCVRTHVIGSLILQIIGFFLKYTVRFGRIYRMSYLKRILTDTHALGASLQILVLR